jgi:hypothetical protein
MNLIRQDEAVQRLRAIEDLIKVQMAAGHVYVLPVPESEVPGARSERPFVRGFVRGVLTGLREAREALAALPGFQPLAGPGILN